MFSIEKDLFFQPEYAALYSEGGGQPFHFQYERGEYYLENLSLRRPIKKIGHRFLSEDYFDLETAYGYGGFRSNSDNGDFLAEAFAQYRKYCQSQNIIAEFLRFHPFNDFPQKHRTYLSFASLDRQTVYLDLRLTDEEQWRVYSQNTRNILRKCEKNLRLEKSMDVALFLDLYRQTMSRNRAQEFYFFDEEYFQKLIRLPGVELYAALAGENVVAMAFFIFGQEIVYYHLSANSEESLSLNANYYLLDQVRLLARKRGKAILYLGGGRSSSEEDSLYRFKGKFSELRAPFWIGGLVHNETVYRNYCDLFNAEMPDKSQVKMFLKYRLGG